MKIIIVRGKTADGTTHFFHRMSSLECAELVFKGLTHDPINQDLNWEMIVDGSLTDWHYPNTGNSEGERS